MFPGLEVIPCTVPSYIRRAIPSLFLYIFLFLPWPVYPINSVLSKVSQGCPVCHTLSIIRRALWTWYNC